ncbi:MAG: ATP-binding protein, partial [Proteobacteria bacterium]
CDEKTIRNVFRRLIHNAAKFADPETNIVIRGRKHNGLYEVAIENLGPAIDEKRVAQLMKPFTLNENALNHSVGTGLGLPISQAILKLHGTHLRFSTTSSTVIVAFDLKLG